MKFESPSNKPNKSPDRERGGEEKNKKRNPALAAALSAIISTQALSAEAPKKHALQNVRLSTVESTIAWTERAVSQRVDAMRKKFETNGQYSREKRSNFKKDEFMNMVTEMSETLALHNLYISGFIKSSDAFPSIM